MLFPVLIYSPWRYFVVLARNTHHHATNIAAVVTDGNSIEIHSTRNVINGKDWYFDISSGFDGRDV